jgi:transposase-like protein
MNLISFKRHRFPPEIIQHAVWLYARFTLSYRDVEDLLAERGIEVSNETVRRWFLKFGRLVAVNLRRSRPCASARWHLDEMVIKIRDRKHWLWRAVDDEGEVLDFLVQPRRCAKSAQRLLRKLLKKQRFSPERITTDKLKSYAVAFELSDFPLFTIGDCERTIALRTHTSRFGGESENSSGSNRQDRPNGSCPSMLPSTTPSTSNAIF